MSHWSLEVQPPISRLRRDSWNWAPRDARFHASGWPSHRQPVIEERYPRRRQSSISDWAAPRQQHRPAVIEKRRPRRRSSGSTEDYSRYRHPQVVPIVLPPLPSRSKRRPTKKKHYFIRPHDGHPDHRRGNLGRFKDALTGEGPDVFVTSTTRERLTRDRPQRWQWSGNGLDGKEILTNVVEPGFAWRELEPVREMPWAWRGAGQGYDFRTRKYGGVDEEVWTGARWDAGARRGSWPERYRDAKFRWWRRVA